MNAVTPPPGGLVRLSRAQTWMAGALLLLLAAALLLPALTMRWIDRAIDRELNAFGTIESPSLLASDMESGFVRLRTALQAAAEGRMPRETVLPALDAFVDQRQRVAQSRASEAFRDSVAYRTMARELEQFLARAEPTLRAPATQRIAPLALGNLLPQATLVESLLRDYTRHAAEAGTAMFIEHAKQARRAELSHGVVLAQGAILALLVLALAAVAWSALVARDRLAREQAELAAALEQLRAAHDHMSASHERETRFMANMSHEIRTPFQGLLGMLSLLDEAALSAQHRKHLNAAREAAQHLLGIVNDILDVSAMEAGHFRIAPEPVRLGDVVGDVVILMRAAAVRKGLRLELALDEGLPEWVDTDPTRLRQVLFNLLSNAVKFTAVGVVNVRVRPDPQRKDFVQFRVSDTGIGMPREVVDNLFKPYFQADASIARRFGGTGLGLEISRRLTQLMGGDITVSSEVGYGSTFCVRLPLAAVPAPLRATQASLSASGLRTPLPASATPRAGRALLSTGAVAGAAKAKPMPRIVPAGEPLQAALRLLVADDNDINLTYMDLLLRRMGHEVVTCTNGAEAVQKAREGGFDGVLLDVHMPVLDGLAAARAIRRMDFDCGAVKIVLVTADVTSATRDQAMASGVDAFVLKPVQQQDLDKALRACGLIKPPRDEEVIALVGTIDPAADVPSARELGAAVAEAAALEITATDRMAAPTLTPIAAPAERDERIDLLALNDSISIMGADSLRQMLGRLFDAQDDVAATLRRALAQGDWSAVRFAAHKLKGTALLLGLGALGGLAQRLEQQARIRLAPDASVELHIGNESSWLEHIDEELRLTRAALASHGVLQVQANSAVAEIRAQDAGRTEDSQPAV
ncbi:MAG: response regulator [Betaproteobacteria bacterium]|nr:response regulator [Betaproteobacteria bacterium]